MTPKRLRLARETIRNLDRGELKRAAGGLELLRSRRCTDACPTNVTCGSSCDPAMCDPTTKTLP